MLMHNAHGQRVHRRHNGGSTLHATQNNNTTPPNSFIDNSRMAQPQVDCVHSISQNMSVSSLITLKLFESGC